MNGPYMWSTKAIDNHFKSHKSSFFESHNSSFFSLLLINQIRCAKLIIYLNFKIRTIFCFWKLGIYNYNPFAKFLSKVQRFPSIKQHTCIRWTRRHKTNEFRLVTKKTSKWNSLPCSKIHFQNTAHFKNDLGEFRW